MENHLIKPRDFISIKRKKEFYNDASYVTLNLKNLTFEERSKPSGYFFKVTYSHSDGKKISFPFQLKAPEFFLMGRCNRENFNDIYGGPFDEIKIESENDIELLIGVSFTDKMA